MGRDVQNELKRLAIELARVVGTDEGARALIVAQQIGLFDRDLERKPQVDPTKPLQRIGCWHREERNGETYFVGRPGQEFSLWGDLAEIPPKGSKKRVIFLGESVARGFFLEPVFTPAKVLQSMLSSISIPEGVEILDLARHDLRGNDLRDLIKTTLALKPDLFLVFAGNNWGGHLPPEITENRIFARLRAQALRDGGVPLLNEVVAGFVRSYTEELLAEIRKTCVAAGVPLVFMLPDCNLTDWQHESDLDCPILASDANERWLAAADAARTAIEGGDFAKARSHALELTELDRGSASLGDFILGQCAQKARDLASARKHFQRARNAHLGIQHGPPTPFSVVQDAIRAQHDGKASIVVDLPEAFDAYLGDELPGSRMFLDYCHLSVEGIIVSMAEAAAAVAPALGAVGSIDKAQLRSGAPKPPPIVQAEAKFGAAIHNTHWGQDRALAQRLISGALQHTHDVVPVMRNMLECFAIRAAACFSRAAERCYGMAHTKHIRSAVADHALVRKLFDQMLSDVIVDSLEEAGCETRAWFTKLRVDERIASPDGSLDLLNPTYAHSWSDFGLSWMKKPEIAGFFKAFSPSSRFPLVSESDSAFTIEVTARVGKNSGVGTRCVVAVNDKPCGEIVPGEKWATATIEVARGICHSGVNTIELQWPSRPIEATADTLRSASWRLEHDIDAVSSFFPVFAEIHSLRATPKG